MNKDMKTTHIDNNFKTHLFVELFYRSHKGLILGQATNENKNIV